MPYTTSLHIFSLLLLLHFFKLLYYYYYYYFVILSFLILIFVIFIIVVYFFIVFYCFLILFHTFYLLILLSLLTYGSYSDGPKCYLAVVIDIEIKKKRVKRDSKNNWCAVHIHRFILSTSFSIRFFYLWFYPLLLYIVLVRTLANFSTKIFDSTSNMSTDNWAN